MNVGYRDSRDDPNRWDRIREAWKVVEPNILSRGRCDPYWFDWDFTPIERDLWTDLRCAGVPMYPQVPVGRFFIDFGDPLERIGLEADGRDFHDVARDRARDEILLREYGWRIYRVTGSQTYPKDFDPFATDEYANREADRSAWDATLLRWALDDSAGVVWAIKALHYGGASDARDAAVAREMLRGAQLVGWEMA